MWSFQCKILNNVLFIHRKLRIFGIKSSPLCSFCINVAMFVVVITNAQFHSNKLQFRFCAGSNPALTVSETRDGEDLWQWSGLEIRPNAFRRLTLPQKQFIIHHSPMFLKCFIFTNCNTTVCHFWNFRFCKQWLVFWKQESLILLIFKL